MISELNLSKNNINFMKAIITILLCSFIIQTYSQTDQMNHEKYWYYRARLKKYFISEGTGRGESLVFSIRNPENNNKLRIAQPHKFFGEYLGILATEYKLLYDEKTFFNNFYGNYSNTICCLQKIRGRTND